MYSKLLNIFEYFLITLKLNIMFYKFPELSHNKFYGQL